MGAYYYHINLLSNFLSHNLHSLKWKVHNFTSPNKIISMDPLYNTQLYFLNQKKRKTHKNILKKEKMLTNWLTETGPSRELGSRVFRWVLVGGPLSCHITPCGSRDCRWTCSKCLKHGCPSINIITTVQYKKKVYDTYYIW